MITIALLCRLDRNSLTVFVLKTLIMRSVKFLKRFFVMALTLTAVFLFFFWNNIGIQSLQSLAPVPIPVKNKVCHVNFDDERIQLVSNKTDLKMIYFVTPTYPRPEQVPELTRLAHTLMHVPRIHWIVADDQPLCSEQVANILRRSGLPFTHISSPKPYTYKVANFPRGVANRRVALSWLLANINEGVLYFGDDDNTVDLQLFDEIRDTKRVSMFPVGLIGGYGVSAPIVKDGKVVGFFDSWPAARRFPVDMAGFAVNIEFLKPSATMPYIAGHEEDMFLVSLGVKLEDIEPLAENCSKVLVWHTKTLKYPKPTLKININQYDKSLSPKYESFVNLLKEISRQGMAVLDAKTGTKTLVIRDRKTYETLVGLN
ncbi:galactosylgalactosylxylosylprotein 3-beta-glucuronosyltransferase S-like [Cydia pomonella]|uniref:galactosylgalactosylxylosylprotein 3-beta-glucuronosyltransferase S-like n=1 Tax=Cydia pomonella TaxID=82600 RepID=UPI002ADE2340|nr:galactosylgalactosylxylosylprotein 3-beta-glucuronosyltransferase S-like [Cydia pomonella]